MLIEYYPDEWESGSEHHTCQYHTLHPGVGYAGCTCSSTYSNRRITNRGQQRRIEETRHQKLLDESIDKYSDIWTQMAKM